MNSPQRFQVGAKAVIARAGRILTLQHTEGYWDLPGGRVDGDETLEAALRREISEELPGATDVQIGRLLAATRIPEVTFPDGSKLLVVIYQVTATVPPQLSSEHTASKWVTPTQALEMGSVVAAGARAMTEL